MSDIEVGDTVEWVHGDDGEYSVKDGDRFEVLNLYPMCGTLEVFNKRLNCNQCWRINKLKKLKEQQMKPKNKEEALRMMDELKKYIEEEDKPVWTAGDIRRIFDGKINIKGGCRMICNPQFPCGNKYMLTTSIFNCFHADFKTTYEMAEWLNKEGYTKE